jgi:hypothetical protein
MEYWGNYIGTEENTNASGRKTNVNCLEQGRPLGGGGLAPGADFEGAPKRRSPTGHTLIRSTVAW